MVYYVKQTEGTLDDRAEEVHALISEGIECKKGVFSAKYPEKLKQAEAKLVEYGQCAPTRDQKFDYYLSGMRYAASRIRTNLDIDHDKIHVPHYQEKKYAGVVAMLAERKYGGKFERVYEY